MGCFVDWLSCRVLIHKTSIPYKWKATLVSLSGCKTSGSWIQPRVVSKYKGSMLEQEILATCKEQRGEVFMQMSSLYGTEFQHNSNPSTCCGYLLLLKRPRYLTLLIIIEVSEQKQLHPGQHLSKIKQPRTTLFIEQELFWVGLHPLYTFQADGILLRSHSVIKINAKQDPIALSVLHTGNYLHYLHHIKCANIQSFPSWVFVASCKYHGHIWLSVGCGTRKQFCCGEFMLQQ